MAKFNLETYKKISGDKHINQRLEEDRSEAPNEVNEKQLEDYRSVEENVTTEKQLEKQRNGGDNEVTERRLDTKKAGFENKYRNPSAYEGDLNKLEEQRLKNDPVEDEKYEDASTTPKAFRWWENVKSPDGLKVAKNITKKNIKIAQVEEHQWEDMEDPEDDFDIAELEVPEFSNLTPFQETLSDKPIGSDVMEIVKNKNISHRLPGGDHYAGIYILLNYDPETFEGDEDAIKSAALSKILSIRENLTGLISEEDIGNIKEEDGIGEVSLRVVGDEFSAIVKSEEDQEQPMEEISYKEMDMGGTPTAVGEIKVNEQLDEEDAIAEVMRFINIKHKDLSVSTQSLDTSRLESEGIVGFIAGIVDVVEEEDSFEIEEVPEESLPNTLSPMAQSNAKKK